MLLAGCSGGTMYYPQCTPMRIISDKEIVDCLPTAQSADTYTFHPIYIAPIFASAGSTVVALSEFEVTNVTDIGIMIGSAIELTADLNTMGLGTFITRPNGFNVSPAMHHAVVTDVGSIRLTDDFNGYVVVWAWAAAEALPENTLLKVEYNYGSLSYWSQ